MPRHRLSGDEALRPDWNWPVNTDTTRRRALPGEPMQFIWKGVRWKREDGCLIWPFGRLTSKTGEPYGMVKYNGQSHTAHRVVLILATGEHPTRYEADACHEPFTCTSRLCIARPHLRWGTRTENLADMIAEGNSTTGPRPEITGEKNGTAKLTEQQVLEIRAIEGMTQTEIGKLYDINQTHVGLIRRRKIWKHI